MPSDAFFETRAAKTLGRWGWEDFSLGSFDMSHTTEVVCKIRVPCVGRPYVVQPCPCFFQSGVLLGSVLRHGFGP